MHIRPDLTSKQRKLAYLGREQGHITIKDIRLFYSDLKTGMHAMRRLCEFGFFQVTETDGVYVYSEEQAGTLTAVLQRNGVKE